MSQKGREGLYDTPVLRSGGGRGRVSAAALARGAEKSCCQTSVSARVIVAPQGRIRSVFQETCQKRSGSTSQRRNHAEARTKVKRHRRRRSDSPTTYSHGGPLTPSDPTGALATAEVTGQQEPLPGLEEPGVPAFGRGSSEPGGASCFPPQLIWSAEHQDRTFPGIPAKQSEAGWSPAPISRNN